MLAYFDDLALICHLYTGFREMDNFDHDKRLLSNKIAIVNF